MIRKTKKIKIGIIGCGAIGSRIAQSITQDFKDDCRLSGLYDIDPLKTQKLAQAVATPRVVQHSLKELIQSAEFIVEAVTAKNTKDIIKKVLRAKRSILVMSVGHLLNAKDIFQLADRNKCELLIPSGAIAGIDAIKAASLKNIKSITLTTRKPPSGFADTPYIAQKQIVLKDIKKETTIFEGKVDEAVKYFPKNINVAATVALAANAQDKLSVRIVTSPEFKTNSHEIEVIGDFGRMVTMTDNVVCPDNPKTSYLAVLSAIQTLKQYLKGVKLGT